MKDSSNTQLMSSLALLSRSVSLVCRCHTVPVPVVSTSAQKGAIVGPMLANGKGSGVNV